MSDNQNTNNQNLATILRVQNLTVYYGTVKALEQISFNVNKGEIVVMVGPNGAGKSTALKAVSDTIEATGGHIETGEISFNGKSIKGLRTDELVKGGISLIPEGRRIFPTMTAIENLEMGAYTLHRNQRSELHERTGRVFDLFPILYERRKQKAGTLSSGEQQMLAIGRALMLKPKLLLADEPSLGLSPNFVELIFDKFVEINRNGTSILLVEQNALMALGICHRGYIFEIGSIILEGQRESLMNNEKVKEAFLGGGNHKCGNKIYKIF